MTRNLSPIDITNMPDLVRLVEEMKTPKQKRTLIKDGDVVAILTREDTPGLPRRKLEKLCLGKDIHTEAPPKTEWRYEEPHDTFATVPVTLTYQGRSVVDEYHLSSSDDVLTPAEMLESLFDNIYFAEQWSEDDWLSPGDRKHATYYKAVDAQLRRVLGADYEVFKQAGKPYRYY